MVFSVQAFLGQLSLVFYADLFWTLFSGFLSWITRIPDIRMLQIIQDDPSDPHISRRTTNIAID